MLTALSLSWMGLNILPWSKCDCGNQLARAMEQIEAAGRGVLLYLCGHEGRGIGLGHKLHAYNLQDDGRDTVEANEELGLPVDSREYGIGARILRDLGVRTMKLMTNNPAKYVGLKGYGLSIAGRVPLLTPITSSNRRYLETKRAKLRHIYGMDSNGHVNGSVSNRAYGSVNWMVGLGREQLFGKKHCQSIFIGAV